MAYTFRHMAKHQGEEVIVLGYNKGDNTVLLVRPSMIPKDEAADLKNFVMTNDAQSIDVIIPYLRKQAHKSGVDWFTYLHNKLMQRNNAVVIRPLKDITELHKDQYAFFAGYGLSAEEKAKQPVETAPVRQDRSVSSAPSVNEERILSSLDDLNQNIQYMTVLLQKLVEKPTTETPAPEKKKPGRKKKILTETSVTAESENNASD